MVLEMRKITFIVVGKIVSKCHFAYAVMMLILLVPVLFVSPGFAQIESKIIYFENNRLTYISDREGNRIPDFSHAGYRGGGVPYPEVPVKEILDPVSGNNAAQIQQALNRVGNLPLDENGIRGAVKLNPGIYTISQPLFIRRSGVVLRGSGDGGEPSENTVFRVTQNVRDAVIQIGEERVEWHAVPAERVNIISEFVPVGARSFEVEDASRFIPGDRVIIRHHSTPDWIRAVDGGGTEGAPEWEPEYLDIYYSREITRISENVITIDAPVFNNLDRNLAQTVIFKPRGRPPVTDSGIENLRIEIQSAHPGADTHASDGVYFNGANHSWARNVTVLHFRRSAFKTRYSAHITVENSRALEPHSPLTGERRYNFSTGHYSNHILFKNVFSTNGRRDFVSNGTSVASGIVFHNARSVGTLGSSEGHQKWSQGLLYDNVVFENPSHYNVLSLHNRGNLGSSHGWGAVHSVAWNVDGEDHYIFIQKPPTAQNYGIGNRGNVSGEGLFNHPAGYIEGTGSEPIPASLYQAQLEERLNYGVSPDAPAKLSVSNETFNKLTLSWLHESTEPVEFFIERSSDGGENFDVISVVPGDERSFDDHDVSDKSYRYRVRAAGSGGKSAYSNLASASPKFNVDAISDFRLQLPIDRAVFLIDGEPDDYINFMWHEAESSLDITYILRFDAENDDISTPVAVFDSLSITTKPIPFYEVDRMFEKTGTEVGDTLRTVWYVTAKGLSFEKKAEQVNEIEWIRGKKVALFEMEDEYVQLDQNYPNPFNPETTIRYHLSEPGEVIIEVYDLRGVRVAKFEEGMRNQGTHRLLFNADRLSSGLYLYRLTTGQIVRTRKMMLIK